MGTDSSCFETHMTFFFHYLNLNYTTESLWLAATDQPELRMASGQADVILFFGFV